MRSKYKSFYKTVVKEVAKSSGDKRIKVGAVIIKDNRIISSGYNGTSPDHNDDVIRVDDKDVSTIHAEMNCVLFAAKQGISLDGCEIVVSHLPCARCTTHMAQAGIKKIYYVQDFKPEENPYASLIPIEKL